MSLSLDLKKLSPLYGEASGTSFVALVPKTLKNKLRLKNASKYRKAEIVFLDTGEIPNYIKESLKGPTHIFCITADGPFRSPPNEILGDAKLGVLPFYSTGFSLEKLVKALEIIYNIDYHEQKKLSSKVLSRIQQGSKLIFESKEYGKSATLDLRDSINRLHLFSQSGPLEWGHQTVLPNGEVSVLTDAHGEYSDSSTFPITGDIVFYGCPILHRGKNPVSEKQHQTFFKKLMDLTKYPCIASVRDGIVEGITETEKNKGNLAKTQLKELMAIDYRYRKIHEIGIGLNPYLDFYLGGNFLPNEMKKGIHFGLGLTPYTDYHLDIVCTSVMPVVADSDTTVELFSE